MKNEYNIEPGQSFGTLPFNLHSMYLSKRCYRFFCKPNTLAGKGKFICEPILLQNSENGSIEI